MARQRGYIEGGAGRSTVPPDRSGPLLYAVSTIVHLILLILFAFVADGRSKGLPGDAVPDAEAGILLKDDAKEDVTFENPTEKFDSPDTPPDPTATKSDPLDAVTMPTRNDAANADPLDALAAEARGALRAGALAPAPVPSVATTAGRAKTSFFKAEAVGNTFVFVIDRSASMSHRNAMGIAKRELLASLEKLTPDCRFQIVFYNGEPSRLPGTPKELMKASKPNLELARSALDRIQPSGETDHVKALMMAFAWRPEVIFFLTDADSLSQIDANRLTEVNRRSAVPATIYTIEFGSGPTVLQEKSLRSLARKNLGTYTYIDVETASAP